MPKQPKEKSPHLQGLEAVFERHTRRFSPFDILGLRTGEGESPELERAKTDQEEISTHIGVDDTHPHEPQTHMEMGATPLPGVYRVDPRVFVDQRGFFMETWQAERYARAHIAGPFVQDNHSRSTYGTLRGLHYQLAHAQGKLVWVVQGEVFDSR